MSEKQKKLLITGIIIVAVMLLFRAINKPRVPAMFPEAPAEQTQKKADTYEADTSLPKGARDNTPECLTPEADGNRIFKENDVTLDASHMENGYIMVKCGAEATKIKMQVTAPNDVVYTYNLYPGTGYTTIPLSLGSGTYHVGVYSNIQDNMYVTIFSQDLKVTMDDTLQAFLYPNTYVDFNADSTVVKRAADVCRPVNDDLEAVAAIYDYVTSALEYDYVKANEVKSGYIPDVDKVLAEGKGICFDYSSVMCSMLRSQRIPARLEIGYAGSLYHAWISTYIEEVGWVGGIIRFDGNDWSLMDPTIASNEGQEELEAFMDNSQYRTLYMY